MAKITKDIVQHVARLARLNFTSDELAKYTQKFSRVLEYVAKLNELKTDNIEPTSHATEQLPLLRLREDVVNNFEGADSILDSAPKTDGRLIEVPKVIENS